MDQVVAQALAMFRRIETGAPTGAIAEAPAEPNGSRVRVVRGRPGR